MDRINELPFLRCVGMIITYQCQISCRHCILECGPNRKEEMSLKDAHNWIDQLAEYDDHWVKILAISGGEPFIDLPRLKDIVQYADRKGFAVVVITNAIWATSVADAADLLDEIPEIKHMAISTDEYHQEKIPIERVHNAIRASNERGLAVEVHLCTDSLDNPIFIESNAKLKEWLPENDIRISLALPYGNAREIIGINKELEMDHEPPPYACTSAATPLIYPDGKIVGCVGPIFSIPCQNPLLLGDLRKETVNDLLERAELNPILHILRLWGPRKLVSLLKESEIKNSLPYRYDQLGICPTCIRLMSDQSLVNEMWRTFTTKEYLNYIAYGRVYYLHEARMLELLLNLDQKDIEQTYELEIMNEMSEIN